MDKITTGQMYAEWKLINEKLQEQINEQDSAIKNQQKIINRFETPISTEVFGKVEVTNEQLSLLVIDILTKLESVEDKISSINKRLDEGLNVSTTDNFVIESTSDRPEGKMGNTLIIWDTEEVLIHDGVDWRDF